MTKEEQSKGLFNNERFRGIIAERGMSLYEFASKMKKSTVTIINWKNGLYQPSLINLKKISEILKVETKELIRS